jgi:hypothetical protein
MRKKPKLIGNYYTFNTAVYATEGDAVIYICDGSPLIDDNKAIAELIKTGNYLADMNELADTLHGAPKAFVKDLEAEPRNRETALMTLDEYDAEGKNLTSGQRTIAEAIFGTIESGDYARSMGLFKEKGILPEIRVLNPEYVIDNAHGKYLVRACAFQKIDSSLVFNASYRELGNHLQMRGVPKPISAGGPSGDWSVKNAFEMLISVLTNYKHVYRRNIPAFS